MIPLRHWLTQFLQRRQRFVQVWDMTSRDSRLIVITGIMAAGKSTVAQAVAERFVQSVHVRGDRYRRSIVNGGEPMTSEPSAQAVEQLRLRHRLAVASAERFCAAGFVTVLQDIIIGPMLTDFVDTVQYRPLSLIVLAPRASKVAERERGRAKIGYTSFSPTEMDRTLRTKTPRLGYWLDSTNLSLEATVDDIMVNLDGPATIG